MTPRKIARKCAALCYEMAQVANESDPSGRDRKVWLAAQARLEKFAATQPDVEERSAEQRVLDAICKASGFDDWWIWNGRLIFHVSGEDGNQSTSVIETVGSTVQEPKYAHPMA